MVNPTEPCVCEATARSATATMHRNVITEALKRVGGCSLEGHLAHSTTSLFKSEKAPVPPAHSTPAEKVLHISLAYPCAAIEGPTRRTARREPHILCNFVVAQNSEDSGRNECGLVDAGAID